MDAVQFGRWISDRRSKYGFRSQRALAERASYDPTLGKLDINENFLARLEAGRLAYPFRGSVRGRVTALAWLLCSTSRDVRTYYQAAGLTELDDQETEQLRVLRKHLAMRHTQRVLPLPLRPQKLIGREPIVRKLIETLCTMDSGHYAITGLPGVGKSALASEALHRLAADERTCLQVFPDGVAALTCAGRQGRSGLFSLLEDVIAIFDPPASSYSASDHKGGSKSHAASTEETGLATMLDRARLVLAGKQTLLLLDNVEAQLPLRQVVEALLAQSQQTLLLQKGGETRHARRVILTTGCYIPPPALVTHHLHLEPLDSDAALQFFTMLMNRSLSPEEVQAVRQVCAAVGYLPLAIQVAATAVAVEGIPLPFLATYVAGHPLDDVLDGAYELRSRLAQAMSDFDADAQKSFALLSTLGVASFELESAVALRSMSANVRSETPHDTPGDQQARSDSEVVPGNQSHDESAAVDGFDLPLERIAGTLADLGRFVRHSLIDLTSPGEPLSPHSPEGTFTDRTTRYRLHPLLYAHALNTLNQVEQKEVQAARRNIQAYALAYIERFQGDTTRLAQEYDLLVASLRRAVQDAQYGHVVHLIEGLAPIVAHMSSYDEGKRLFLWGIQASRYLSDHLHHVSFLNDLGLLSRRHEDFALATRVWTESLEIAASSLSHHQQDIWCPLSELAHIAHVHGEVEVSLRYAETYLKHCQESGDPIDTARALHIYAFYARLQGDHERAYKHASSARDIFSRYHPIQMSPAEQLLGLRVEAELARAESNYPASQAPVEQAASLIQMIGNQYLLADTLFDQACFAQQQGMYDDARRLAQRTIQIAESGKLSHFYRRGTLLLRQLAEATYD